MTDITIDESSWTTILHHLLPKSAVAEEAAFLFGRLCSKSDAIHVVSYQLLSAGDFVSREADHLELDDRSRATLIKRAHNIHACLIEIHSHLGCRPAAFSTYDFLGLRETVPHMHWRLRDRPYCAIVVAEGSLDALIWEFGSRDPSSIGEIKAGAQVLRPTNLSLGHWNE